jgi:hypothetical protein
MPKQGLPRLALSALIARCHGPIDNTENAANDSIGKEQLSPVAIASFSQEVIDD